MKWNWWGASSVAKPYSRLFKYYTYDRHLHLSARVIKGFLQYENAYFSPGKEETRKDTQAAVLPSFLPPLHPSSLYPFAPEFQLRGFKVNGSVVEGIIKQGGCFSVIGLGGLSRSTAK